MPPVSSKASKKPAKPAATKIASAPKATKKATKKSSSETAPRPARSSRKKVVAPPAGIISEVAEEPTLSVEGLRLVRGGTPILSDLSWSVSPNQHWAILGANGSGKTSLLSVLTGYLTPTGGLIRVLGQQYGRSNWVELRKSIGIVSSSIRQAMPDHEPVLTTIVSGKYAMIDYWGRVKRQDRADAEAILKQVNCEHLADRPWLVLSQGERQRVLIGRALMARPRLLILDEPCAGLDPVARELFLEFLQQLTRQKEAPVLLLVTHHVEEIVDGISHVLMLKKGAVLAAGERDTTLTAENLGEAFGEKLSLISRDGRLWLELQRRGTSTKHLFTGNRDI